MMGWNMKLLTLAKTVLEVKNDNWNDAASYCSSELFSKYSKKEFTVFFMKNDS